MAIIEWDRAPDVSRFRGRPRERQTLRDWTLSGHCRLAVVEGFGGIGKSILAAAALAAEDQNRGHALDNEVEANFAYALWRPLQNAPPLKTLVGDLASVIGDSAFGPEDGIEKRITRLIALLTEQRCLIVLDNLESLLTCENGKSQFRRGYEDYDDFLWRLANASHQSVVVVTTRELPAALRQLCSPSGPARYERLDGVDGEACRAILADQGLVGEEALLDELAQAYRGHPLALKLVAARVLDAHKGDIQQFLDQNRMVFSDIEQLLEWHASRLSDAERQAFYALALNRSSMNAAELARDVRGALYETSELAERLVRKVFFERMQKDYSVQPVLMEFAVERVVRATAQNIVANAAGVIEEQALSKGAAPDFVRRAQEALVLRPILQVLDQSGSDPGTMLGDMISRAREEGWGGHAAGNCLNLMGLLEGNLAGKDFSRLTLRNAFLRDVSLADTDFTDATFVDPAFATNLGAVVALTVCTERREIFSGDMTGAVTAWDLGTGALKRVYRGHSGWVRSIAIAPDGNTIATGATDYKVKIWERESAICLRTLPGHVEQVYCVDFDQAGQHLVSGGEGREIIVWRAADGEPLSKLDVTRGRVRSVKFLPTDSTIIYAGADQIELWRWADKERLEVKGFGEIGCVRRLSFDGAGKTLACLGETGPVLILDAQSLEQIGTPKPTGRVQTIDLARDGDTLAIGYEDGRVEVWRLDTQKRIADFEGHTRSVRAVAFAGDDHVVSGGEDRTVRVWRIDDKTPVRIVRGYTNAVRAVSATEDGFVSAGEDGAVSVWRWGQIQPDARFAVHDKTIEALAVSPDQATIATASDDHCSRTLERATGAIAHSFSGHAHWVWHVAFSADGAQVLTASRDRTAKLWSASTGQLLRTFEGHQDEVHAGAFLDNGDIATASDDDTLIIWDKDAKPRWRFTHHNDCVRALAYSPETKRLASCSDDGSVKVWALDALGDHGGEAPQSCDPILNRRVSEKRLLDIAFTPGGQTLIAGGDDGLVREFSAHDLSPIRDAPAAPGAIWSLAQSHDGKHIVSGRDTGEIAIWHRADGAQTRVRPPRLFEGMRISGVKGLSEADLVSLEMLGATREAARSVTTDAPGLDCGTLPLALIFSGGGVRGLAYAGALKELEPHYDFGWYVGTSAGAITAALLAAGYSVDELREIGERANFVRFIADDPIAVIGNVISSRSFSRGLGLTNWLEELLRSKLDLEREVTLADLPKRVSIHATMAPSQQIIFDSASPGYKTTPVTHAVRSSMAIPIIFTPVMHESKRMMDGGLKHNLPVIAHAQAFPGAPFLALHLGPGGNKTGFQTSLGDDVISMATGESEREAFARFPDKIISIDTRPISTTDFFMGRREKQLLIDAGTLAARKFLARQRRREEGGA